MPVRVLITEGTRADCKEAIHLIDGISAETLLADRGYDTNQIIAYAADAGMNIVIPAKRNRKQQREYDRYLYRLRHLVENAFFAPETLARRCYSICKNYNIFSGCCANSLHCYLVYCFDLILCRHYLMKKVFLAFPKKPLWKIGFCIGLMLM